MASMYRPSLHSKYNQRAVSFFFSRYYSNCFRVFPPQYFNFHIGYIHDKTPHIMFISKFDLKVFDSKLTSDEKNEIGKSY